MGRKHYFVVPPVFSVVKNLVIKTLTLASLGSKCKKVIHLSMPLSLCVENCYSMNMIIKKINFLWWPRLYKQIHLLNKTYKSAIFFHFPSHLKAVRVSTHNSCYIEGLRMQTIIENFSLESPCLVLQR